MTTNHKKMRALKECSLRDRCERSLDHVIAKGLLPLDLRNIVRGIMVSTARAHAKMMAEKYRRERRNEKARLRPDR